MHAVVAALPTTYIFFSFFIFLLHHQAEAVLDVSELKMISSGARLTAFFFSFYIFFFFHLEIEFAPDVSKLKVISGGVRPPN